MDPIWIVHLEVVAFVEGAPAKGKLGFINVVVSAGDAKNARSKVITVLESYDWKILRIQSVVVADSDLTYKDDLEELIENVKTNPHLVLLSTLHCYKAN